MVLAHGAQTQQAWDQAEPPILGPLAGAARRTCIAGPGCTRSFRPDLGNSRPRKLACPSLTLPQ